MMAERYIAISGPYVYDSSNKRTLVAQNPDTVATILNEVLHLINESEARMAKVIGHGLGEVVNLIREG